MGKYYFLAHSQDLPDLFHIVINASEKVTVHSESTQDPLIVQYSNVYIPLSGAE